jgi:hypothetical protein
MEENKYFKIPKLVVYGLYFILAGVIINFIFRDVFHSVTIDKIVLFSDPEGYFQYLPHFFLRDWDSFNHLPWTIPFGEEKSLSVFTCGIALLWTPFFLLAHFISVFFNLDAYGYGNVYYGFVLIAALFYVYTGLVFLYRLIIKEFEKKIGLYTVLLLFLGTNLFYYTMILGAGMSHAYSFSMIATYMYFTHRFFESGKLKHAIYLAIPFAIAVLIRPTNLIAGLYFFLFGFQDGPTFIGRIKFWFRKPWVIGVVILAGLIVTIPQMLYWHKVTGKFIFYSYQNFGFPFWKNPKIGTVLFGEKNGWFLYTPLVIFSMYGLFRAIWKKSYNSLAVLLILLLAVYINASWWAPTFSAAVGQRAMIDFLPFLAFPLALVVKKFFEQPVMTKVVLIIVLLAILFFNIQYAFRYDPYEWWDKPFTWTKFWRTLSF